MWVDGFNANAYVKESFPANNNGILCKLWVYYKNELFIVEKFIVNVIIFV